MARGPFGFPRLTSLGPFSESDFNEVTSEEEVLSIAEVIVDGTPARIKDVMFMDYFSDPSAVIDLELPSQNELTMDRVAGTTSIVFSTEDLTLNEMSIRFPAVDGRQKSLKEVELLLEDIVDKAGTAVDYRVRVVEIDMENLIHPHVHYSKTRREVDSGPPMVVVAQDVNAIIKSWYGTVGMISD